MAEVGTAVYVYWCICPLLMSLLSFEFVGIPDACSHDNGSFRYVLNIHDLAKGGLKEIGKLTLDCK